MTTSALKKAITMAELFEISKKIKSDELILDVRTAEEFAEGHVPGAQNIPHDGIAEHAPELKKFSTIYMYCRSGGRVQFSCQILEALGVNCIVPVAQGGMPDWIHAGYPIA